MLEAVEEALVEEIAEEIAEETAASAPGPSRTSCSTPPTASRPPSEDGELGGWVKDERGVRPVECPYDRPGRWYVVHTYSGYENKVRSNMGNVVASVASRTVSSRS